MAADVMGLESFFHEEKDSVFPPPSGGNTESGQEKPFPAG